MKLFKVYTVVAATHLSVVFLLLFQPGCQHSSKPSTQRTSTDRVTHPPRTVIAGDAQNRVILSKEGEAALEEVVPVNSGNASAKPRNLYPPTRPAGGFSPIQETQPEIMASNTVDDSFNRFTPPVENVQIVTSEDYNSNQQFNSFSSSTSSVEHFQTVTSQEYNQEPIEVINMSSGVVNPELNAFQTQQTYTVVKGDNLTKIARAHDVTLEELMHANGLNKKSILKIGQLLLIPGESQDYDLTQIETPAYEAVPIEVDSTVYIVVPGDSLSKIAKQHGSTVATIKSVNGLTSNTIYAGQDLLIPKTGSAPTVPVVTQASSSIVSSVQSSGEAVHVVKRGDSLSKIAKQYGVRVNDLMQLNGISDPHRIQVGQSIKIGKAPPSSGISVPPASRKETVIYESEVLDVPPVLNPAVIEPALEPSNFDEINLDDVPVVPIENTQE